MRGILYPDCDYAIGYRITPAHAGNTSGEQSRGKNTMDHPRTCGEYCPNRSQIRYFSGSPPHMRGIQIISDGTDGGGRITPAHAGNTGCPSFCSFRTSGSPPHMRGIRNHSGIARQQKRITPAHAGNTRGNCIKQGKNKDHPRTCGEYAKNIFSHSP